MAVYQYSITIGPSSKVSGVKRICFTVEALVKGTLWLLLLFDALKNSIIRICGVTTDSTYAYTFFSSLQIGPY